MSTEPDLTGNFDATEWARQFVKTVLYHPTVPLDEGAMIGWFANALMAGHDHALRELAIELEGTKLARVIEERHLLRSITVADELNKAESR